MLEFIIEVGKAFATTTASFVMLWLVQLIYYQVRYSRSTAVNLIIERTYMKDLTFILPAILVTGFMFGLFALGVTPLAVATGSLPGLVAGTLIVRAMLTHEQRRMNRSANNND